MTALARALLARIDTDGPMPLAAFMAECLTHPKHGYYKTQSALGRTGDFITAPEVSQMFGELIGLALAETWRLHRAPGAFSLIELGPGRGTLMADALRAASGVPGFRAAMNLFLFEVSPLLRAQQSKALAHDAPRWIDRIEDLPPAPLFGVANEFFDALPIRQFLREGNGWREKMVGRAPDVGLTFGWSPPAPIAELSHRLNDTQNGDIVETCAPALAVAEALAGHIAAHGGAIMLIDYGDWRALGDTFQAVSDHRKTDPLAKPGRADLTAHVDFEPLAHAATRAGARYTRLVPQGVFLERLGITARAQMLARGLTGDRLQNHIAAHRRLTHPAEMGTLFKVMAIHAPDTPPPPGMTE